MGLRKKICYIADPGSVHIRRWINYFMEKGYDISVISYNPVTLKLPFDMDVYDLTKRFNTRKIDIWSGL